MKEDDSIQSLIAELGDRVAAGDMSALRVLVSIEDALSEVFAEGIACARANNNATLARKIEALAAGLDSRWSRG